jgi:hypothetical protein
MTLRVLNGPIIRAGESLSEGLDCTMGQLVRLTMPPEWTDAPLTFQISSDNVFYNDMFGLDGYEITIKEVVPGSGVILTSDIGRAVAWIKFRSGTRGAPKPQPVERNFSVAVQETAPTLGTLGVKAASKVRERVIAKRKK